MKADIETLARFYGGGEIVDTAWRGINPAKAPPEYFRCTDELLSLAQRIGIMADNGRSNILSRRAPIGRHNNGRRVIRKKLED